MLDVPTIMRHLRTMYPEFSKVKESEFAPLIEIAYEEVCKEGYNEHNCTKALTLYTLHLYTDIKQRGDNCYEDYRQDIISEKDNDVQTNYTKIELIDGVKPLNKYHYLFLNVPRCKIRSSFLHAPVTTGCGSQTGAWSGTDRVPYTANTTDKQC